MINYESLWVRLQYKLIGLARKYIKQEEQRTTLLGSKAVYSVMDLMEKMESEAKQDVLS